MFLLLLLTKIKQKEVLFIINIAQVKRISCTSTGCASRDQVLKFSEFKNLENFIDFLVF